MLEVALSPRSVAVIGASENPHKVGGRPTLLGALRGQPAHDVQAFARMAVRLGEAMLEWDGAVTLIDVNPVVVFETGKGAVAVDALVERLIISSP